MTFSHFCLTSFGIKQADCQRRDWRSLYEYRVVYGYHGTTSDAAAKFLLPTLALQFTRPCCLVLLCSHHCSMVAASNRCVL